MTGSPWPLELRYRRETRTLEVDFDDGRTVALPAELLRVESPSAEVRGHGASQKQIVPGKRGVGVSRIEPVGNYAARIVFDDGHDTGLYSWDLLYDLGRDKDEKLRIYRDTLRLRALRDEA